MREQRSLNERKLAAPRFGVVLKNIGARDVRRHHIGRKLDAAKRQAQDAGDCRNEQRLGQARHANQEHVPARKEPDQKLLDHFVLADHHLGDLVTHPAISRRQFRGGGQVGMRFCLALGHLHSLFVEKRRAGWR